MAIRTHCCNMKLLGLSTLLAFSAAAHAVVIGNLSSSALIVQNDDGQMPYIIDSDDVAAPKKRGLSYNDPNLTKNFGSKLTWAYNWGQTPGNLPKKYNYVPMLWGLKSGLPDSWHANAEKAIKQGATHLLGFNEPDNAGQANMSPAAAATAWKKYMQPFAGKAKLCSPAITNGGPPAGQAWLDSFLKACTGCRIDCIAIHIYDSPSNVAYFKEYIAGVGKKYKKPVWVTEFGTFSGTEQQQVAFVKQMLPYLDGLSSVERYAYFMAAPGILVDNSGKLSPLGQAYNSD